MPEGFAKGIQGYLGSEMKIALRIKATGGSEAMDMGVEGNIIAKRVDTYDNSHLALGLAGGLADAFRQYLDDYAAEDGQSLGVLSEDIADHFGNGEHPMPVWHGKADLLRDRFSFFEGAPLVAGRADSALFTGEREEVFVVALLTAYPQEALG
jgi:hypothetical protein